MGIVIKITRPKNFLSRVWSHVCFLNINNYACTCTTVQDLFLFHVPPKKICMTYCAINYEKKSIALLSSFLKNLYVFFSGIDFKIKTVELGGKKIKLQIW